MSEVRTINKTEEVKVEAVSKKAKKAVAKTDVKKTLPEMRIGLQRLILDVKSAKETNTSLIKKLKKEIAKELTKINMSQAN